MRYKKGLSHLDAEAVICRSSLYKGTAEMQNAVKKPHKTRKSADFLSADFNILRKIVKISCFFFSYSVVFVLR